MYIFKLVKGNKHRTAITQMCKTFTLNLKYEWGELSFFKKTETSQNVSKGPRFK